MGMFKQTLPIGILLVVLVAAFSERPGAFSEDRPASVPDLALAREQLANAIPKPGLPRPVRDQFLKVHLVAPESFDRITSRGPENATVHIHNISSFRIGLLCGPRPLAASYIRIESISLSAVQHDLPVNSWEAVYNLGDILCERTKGAGVFILEPAASIEVILNISPVLNPIGDPMWKVAHADFLGVRAELRGITGVVPWPYEMETGVSQWRYCDAPEAPAIRSEQVVVKVTEGCG